MKGNALLLCVGLFCVVVMKSQGADAAPAPIPAAPTTNAPTYTSFLLHGNTQHVPPEVRARLVELLELDKDKLWQELSKWPPFQKMSLQEQSAFLARLAEMRQKAHNQAFRKANELGLKIPPEQQEAFVHSYLQERVDMEKKFSEETEEIHRRLEGDLNASLTAQFGHPEASSPAPESAPAH